MAEEKTTSELPFAKSESELKAEQEKDEKHEERKFEKPPKLKTVVSMSCSMPARDFSQIVKKNGITAVLDTRNNRDYRGAGFQTSEDDFRFLCELIGVKYFVVESLSPTQELRRTLNDNFKEVRSSERDPYAWTNFLAGYESLLKRRRPFRNDPLAEIINGDFEVIAVVCACQHHDDCHRSFATGLMKNLLPGVELVIAYPEGKPPYRKSPRRYRLKDFPWAGLKAEKQGGKK